MTNGAGGALSWRSAIGAAVSQARRPVRSPGVTVESSRAGAAQIALLACLVLLVAPATGRALIVPQRGIAGISLKMTRAQVVRAKGRPNAERLVHNELIGRQRTMRYGSTRALFGGFRPTASVVTINTRDPAERTRSGIGVGSTVSEVRRGVRGIHCRQAFGVRSCFKGSFRPGERVTVFDVSSDTDRVRLVTVGFVID